MCGIIGVVGRKQNAPQLVIDGLKRLEYRGYDSWGVAFSKRTGLTLEREIGKLEESGARLKQLAAERAKLALGHTRWATHGGRTVANAHPHRSCDGRIVLVHNGIIENYQELRDELKAVGHRFQSETDTEVLAHLIEAARPDTKTLAEAVRLALGKIQGSFAIAVFEVGGRELVGARRGSPLVIGLGLDQAYLASDVPAFLAATRWVIFLEENDLVVLNGGRPVIRNLTTNKIVTRSEVQISWDAAQAERGEHPDFMHKEIFEQPATLRRALGQPRRELERFAKLIHQAYGVFLVGCGSAYHAGLTGLYLFSHLAKRHVNLAVASEFPCYEEFLTPKTLLVPISQSGETADTLEAVRAAKRRDVKVAAIVNVQGSTLMREADQSLLTLAGPELCVLATKSFTSQVALLTLLAYTLADQYRAGRNLLERAADELDAQLAEGTMASQLQALARTLKAREHLYTVGRSLNYPTALEAALKIKEVSYLHAEGFAGGELKHGSIALIEAGTPVLVFASRDHAEAEILANAMELKSRGAQIIGIAPRPNEIFSNWLPVTDLPEAMPILGAIPAQLLAYELALARGLDPDKPRNLAKSVTVK
ncbi:glutamine--fructose-6-phosphate transaminase (isomerizing) [Candidatus Berkelbacteria bacterium]|nr:glutamine--fructose-6-phosphate transaminase (isomerizing) [Candidatus Berkelbacteria bacterium]